MQFRVQKVLAPLFEEVAIRVDLVVWFGGHLEKRGNLVEIGKFHHHGLPSFHLHLVEGFLPDVFLELMHSGLDRFFHESSFANR